MKIGIDIDEVVAEFVNGYLEKYKEKYKREVKFKDIFSYNLWEPLKISKQEAIELADFYYDSPEFDNIKLLEGAKEALSEISKNHELILITSRPIKLKEKTNNFMNRHFSEIPLRIIFSSDFFKEQGKTKTDICKDLEIDFFIEDNKDYAFNCADKGVKVFLFSKPWNQDCLTHRNITRVHDWDDILQRLKEVENG